MVTLACVVNRSQRNGTKTVQFSFRTVLGKLSSFLNRGIDDDLLNSFDLQHSSASVE